MVLGSLQSAFAGTYVVKEGDWLSTIAPKYNTTWQKLAEINNLKNPNLIYPKQVLQLPDLEVKAPEEKAAEAAITGLDLVDISNKNIFDETAFDPAKTDYAATVQSDIYGVLLKVTADADTEITVTASATTYKAFTQIRRLKSLRIFCIFFK